MMRDGFIMGPFSEDNLPFKVNRFSGLMVKLKPDSSARMIRNLSKGSPVSVNSSIDSNMFPTKMSSTIEFVRNRTVQIMLNIGYCCFQVHTS